MILLGIDTSSYVNAVGITDGERVIQDVSFSAKTDSLEQIVDNIDATLRKAGLALKDVGGIGVGLGPGSWTGIRVGVTVGKVLAFSTSKPVAGVATLEALAWTARSGPGVVYPVISAGIKDAVYAARYRVTNDSVIKEGDYFTGNIRELAALIREPVTLVGKDIEHYGKEIVRENAYLNDKVKTLEAKPGGAAIAILAGRRLAGGQADDPLSLVPLYLKESTARVFVSRYSGSTG